MHTVGFTERVHILLQAQKKMEHSKSTSQTADQTYQDAVKNLEEARVLWEREMELLCNVSGQLYDLALSSHVLLCTAISRPGRKQDCLPASYHVDTD